MDSHRNADDSRRLDLLRMLDLLSSDPEPALDRLSRIAAAVTGSEIALIAFTAGGRQFIRSRVGTQATEASLPEGFGFCTPDGPPLVEICDATRDARCVDNALVCGPQAIHSYAGCRVLFEGQVLGTVCVLDSRARRLTDEQRAILADVAGMVEALLQSRHKHVLLHEERRHAVELAAALGESEAMLEQAQRLARMGCWEIDIQTGLIAWSAALYEMFARDPKLGPITVHEFRDLVDEADRAEFDATTQRAFFQHRATQTEFRYVAPDGRPRWIAAVSEPVHDLSGRVARVRGTMQDITERKQTERLVRESAERDRLLWQTSTDVVLMVGEDDLIRFCNPAITRVLGHRPEEVVGQPLTMLQPARMHALHRQGFTRYIASGVRKLDWRAVEIVALHRDGREIPVEISFSDMQVDGQRIFGAFMRDISQRMQQQQALKGSEERFRSLTMLSSDWYWEHDDEFRLTQVVGGRAYDNNVGLRRQIGQRPWEAASEGMDPTDWDRHRRQLEAHEPFRDFEITHLGTDGGLTTVSVSGEPVFDAQGRFTGYRGVGRDITEQRRGQAVRLELETQLREAQKMEAIGVLAGGIAHDFNNVLAGILGNVALAIQDLAPAHPAAVSLDQIRKAGLRGRGLVQQILAFARRQPREVVSCELRPLVEECVGLLRATLPAGVALETALCDEPLFVMADATQVGQVLMNLCTNAWHSLGGKPGRLAVALDGVELDAVAARQLGAGLAPGDYARLSVADNGRGMDAETRARIFEPFFTTKPVGEGTGLGLAVAHGIVAAHGGVIRVQTAQGQGSRFEIYLPRSAGTDSADRLTPLAIAHRGHDENVLYIDDDDVMAVMVERLLQRMGYVVTCLRDPAHAIDVVRAAPQAFDIVVTDLNMPELSGLDVARALHLIRPDLPVVISSGNLPDQLQNEARQAGVRALVHKQYTLEELGAVIHWVLAGGQRLGLEPMQLSAR